MNSEKYSISQDTIKNILGYIDSNQIAIPELQRPFVWEPKQITKLIKSLYLGLPTGFMAIWINNDVKLKDGTMSTGKKIIIDGQQRISALRTALLGKEIINKEYKKVVQKVAYNPFEEDVEKMFETQKPTHINSSKWIEDISIFFKDDNWMIDFMDEYIQNNPQMTKKELSAKIVRLKDILTRNIGIISLNSTVKLEEATNIFILMNNEGTSLGQEDFIMAKMASDTEYDGDTARKAIEYFCMACRKPSFIDELKKVDPDFVQTEYYKKMEWVKNYRFDVYIPTYNDVIRASYTHKFRRAILKNLVELLAGRNFETKEYEQEKAKESYNLLKEGILSFINEYNFTQFITAIKSCGFVSSKMIGSKSAITNAYVIYLMLQDINEVPKIHIKQYVQKWYVISLLSGRYSGTSEGTFDKDIRGIEEKGFENYFKEFEQAVISDNLWNVQLIQRLNTNNVNSPIYNLYLASQVSSSKYSLFSNNILIRDLIENKGDRHHIFPKEYLRGNGITEQTVYNKVANFTYIDKTTNIDIGKKPPKKYFNEIKERIENNDTKGIVKTLEKLRENLQDNCIPENIYEMDYRDYREFIEKRIKMMSNKIKEYYESL